MQYSGPLLSDGDVLSDAAALALLGEVWGIDEELRLEPVAQPELFKMPSTTTALRPTYR